MATKVTETEISTTTVASYTDLDGNIVHKPVSKRTDIYTTTQSTTQKADTPISNNIDPKSAVTKAIPITIIDVIKDYDWTYSSRSLIKNSEVPYVYLKEFKMLGNSYMSSLLTSALLFPDIAKSALDANSPAQNLFETVKTTFKDNKFGKFMSEIGNTTSDVVNKLLDTTKKSTDWVKSQMESIDNTANGWTGTKQELIDNYKYLYLRKPTNTQYKFPYFPNGFFSINNDFQDSYSSGNQLTADLFNKTMDIIGTAEKFLSAPLALSEPGVFIQRPKFYNFNPDGYEIEVNFHLFNTLNPDSYLKNLELITKLVIQNTPHRHNRLLVDPICIYELTIPGRGFYPYTYISNLTVDHVGTKRILKGSNGNDIIVPDAFSVTLKLKSLTAEVNNFIIPETGTAGINVSQRYGLGGIVKGMMDNATSIAKQEIQTVKTPNDLTKNTSVVMNTPSVVGRTSQPIRIAGGA